MNTITDDQGHAWHIYATRDGRVCIEREGAAARKPIGFAAADLIEAVAAAVARDETAVWA